MTQTTDKEASESVDTRLARLINAARAGDKPALDELFAHFRPILRAKAAQDLAGRPNGDIDPSDVVQVTLWSAFESLPSFKGTTPRDFQAWLNGISDNRLCDLLRRFNAAKRGARLRCSLDAVSGERGAMAGELDGGKSKPCAQATRNEEFDRAVAKLPEDQQLALSMRYCDDAKLADIAAQLGQPPGETALVIERGLRALRRRLADAADE